MKQAQEELDAVVGSHRVVEEDDIKNLPFLQAIIKEAFRLHRAVPLSLPRLSIQATELLGYQLPNEMELLLNLYAIHRDPVVYEEPEIFNPTRFIEQYADVTPTSGFDHYELIPVSAGRHMCPAYNLGILMINLILAHLLHNFNWSLPDGEYLDMTKAIGITLQKAIRFAWSHNYDLLRSCIDVILSTCANTLLIFNYLVSHFLMLASMIVWCELVFYDSVCLKEKMFA